MSQNRRITVNVVSSHPFIFLLRNLDFMLLLSVLMPVFAAPVVSVTAAVAAVITVAVSDTVTNVTVTVTGNVTA